MQAADRSLRSVFVGNIPYDATEERLRDIFSAVGPVLSFRIVFDRETGKPKGYGFCEYKDQETATSAIRNLNGHDLGGRQLRVDSASNERARDEPDQQQQQQTQATGGSINVDPGQAHLQNQAPVMPEPLVDAQTVINNVLCSLPPEQLFEVCKQLKTSLLVNPNETRQMLVQNPQLSFAILQSLVMIKAIDAQTAMNTLHKQLVQPAPLQPAPIPMMTPMMAPMMQPQVMPAFPFVAGDPRFNTADPRVTANDSRMTATDPRLNSAASDPRLVASDPRLNADPRLVAADPRLASADPRLAATDPRLAATDPRLAQPDPVISLQGN